MRRGTHLEDTEQDTRREQSLPVLHPSHSQLDNTPREDEEGEPVANTKTAKDDISRDLTMRLTLQR